MERLSVLAVLALVPAVAQASGFQFFHYKNAKDLSRMCRGDTATGEAICVDAAVVSANTVGAAAPAWETSDTAETSLLRYRSPFEKPGLYQFFTYNKASTGEPRVCVGDTSSGEARCADGATQFATTKGSTKPEWQVDPKLKLTVLRYFPDGKPGTFGFGAYYSRKGEVRICQMETASGVAVCVDAALTVAQQVGDGKLGPWDPVNPKDKFSYFRYFEKL